MAESLVQVTEGSGKKLHTFQRTIGANNVEDEVMLLGENYLASYLANFNNGGGPVSTATLNSHIVQIMAGASLKVRIRRIEVYQIALATTAALASFGIVRLTTAGTGGTVQAVSALDGSDAAAGATYMSLPTVKGTESNFIHFAGVYFMQTAGASAQLNQPIYVADFDRPRSKPLIIGAGTTNGIALKLMSAVAAASVWVNVWIDESNF
jgi:hypothetical protein